MAFDAARSEVVLFGGANYAESRVFADTWSWDGTSWTERHPAHSPAARDWPALAYDDALGEVVLFGGGIPGAAANSDETWTWDGSDWSEQQPEWSPPGRHSAAMAYDAARGLLVLFGGLGQGGYLNDTWTYDGRTWTPVCGVDALPACGPPPGLGNAMAYDPLHQQIVMFGGSNGDNYTWTWDGSGWTLQQPAQSPPAPQFGTLVFDAALGQIVLVGSDLPGFGTVGNELWGWDGSDWRQLQPAASPPRRRDAAVVFDPLSGGVLLFGGGQFANGVQTDLNDTWLLR